MKARSFCAIVSSLSLYSAANAQAPDFSGVYAPPVFVNTPAVREPDAYPFTAEGERAFKEYNPIAQSPKRADDCAPESVPGVLWLGAPMEIVQEDDRITMRYERENTTRTIWMNGATPAADQPHTALGFSMGRWVDDVLTVETTNLLGGSIRNNRGHQLSREARLTERYWRESGEFDLQVELLVDDPVNYTEIFSLGREWIWAPKEVLRPWVCVSLGPRGSEEPDIDELARMLEEL